MGLALISIVNYALGLVPTTTSIANNMFFETLTKFYIQDMSSLLPFTSVLIAWTITGFVAGIMEKKALRGAITTMITLVVNFCLFLGLGTLTGGEIGEWIIGTLLGGLGVIVVASIAGYVGGKYAKTKTKTKTKRRDRKIWKNEKYADRWICSNCGEKIPPGSMNCPNCGAGVIE